MKIWTILLFLGLLQSYAFGDDKCTAVLKKIESSYKERKDQAVTNFLVKSIDSNTTGTLSLTQVYSHVFNSPKTHMLTFSTGKQKTTGIAHIEEMNNVCVLAIGISGRISDNGGGFGHDISINAQGIIEIHVEKNDKDIVLPSSTIIPVQ
ncbi:MAG: hypothetical protein A2504_12430 [Bdellovibrionales bacterium RIFOXYD12_FULL_39_22]|nr:MAG: hypothetical protein A2385_15920 [Bdellovibrionales bacterium RIFOXYB1_FULL_39_21]OFZ40679.1 MAG: hypothetical protein A2485_04525 [Bdellovibrionales bacterium RIFOXYC12_FULL_39_17]OFZ49723.1 MAG: hypothetical protein A2404_01555 [Bdellovibrionales bacterium RIFOXYC1_FULL_39_130]OFZ71982.1 MAG: hypothetical protein A2451_15125 [Bdellovibrionales bacterium RIFOXYC2_FULL_39_8]OFZ77271.1 MAG: hypothetical protein A2560_11775 [Bdellovibrionales bacterium RIFOXYD1_FULL_39_84]OFZ91783.1 MAG: